MNMEFPQAGTRKQPKGMAAFIIVWIGQLVSVIATQMTGFAMTIWIYQKTSRATALGLAQVFWVTPYLLISPVAGVMVDRYSRKLMMMVSDIGAGLTTAAILLLQAMGMLQVWHIYVAVIFQGWSTPSSGRLIRPPSPPWSPRHSMGAPTE
jgi:sugar phosphate permease